LLALIENKTLEGVRLEAAGHTWDSSADLLVCRFFVAVP
jgi:hypothetical protein